MALGVGTASLISAGLGLAGSLFGGGGGGEYSTSFEQPSLAPLPLQNEIMSGARSVNNQYSPWVNNPWRPIDYFQGVGTPGNYAPQFGQTGLPSYPVGGNAVMGEYNMNPLSGAAGPGQGAPLPGAFGGQQQGQQQISPEILAALTQILGGAPPQGQPQQGQPAPQQPQGQPQQQQQPQQQAPQTPPGAPQAVGSGAQGKVQPSPPGYSAGYQPTLGFSPEIGFGAPPMQQQMQQQQQQQGQPQPQQQSQPQPQPQPQQGQQAYQPPQPQQDSSSSSSSRF